MQGLDSLILSLGDWTWWVVALVLFLLELLAPGVFFLWLGIAAVIVGIASLLVDWSWQWQVASFAVLSLISLILSRIFLVNRPIESDRPLLNRRADQLVGREFVLEEALVAGTGRIRVEDTLWRVTGPDIPAGRRVRVTEVRDGVLVVGAID